MVGDGAGGAAVGCALVGFGYWGANLARNLAASGATDLVADGLAGRVMAGGEPHRPVVGFAGAEPIVDRTWIQQCLAERDILFNDSLFGCARHTDTDVDSTLAALDDAFERLARHGDVRSLLTGPPVEPVF